MLGTMGEGPDPVTARNAMVASQLRGRGITDERVLEAMASVPREAFVSPIQAPWAYADEALPIEVGQTISQPYMVARMTELLSPRPGDRVLEVGTGSGYQAAVLAWLGADVVTIERHAELAAIARERLDRLGLGERVEIRVGDGSLGAPDAAPFSRIIVTAAAPSIPSSLREQLAPDGGRLVIPVGPRDRQELMLVIRDGDEWRELSDGPCVFVPLVGEEGYSTGREARWRENSGGFGPG
jgi:protein-L-isoaspartate(D-aspartate) O-methyltransferase